MHAARHNILSQKSVRSGIVLLGCSSRVCPRFAACLADGRAVLLRCVVLVQCMVSANSSLKAVLQQRDAELAAQRELLQQQGELLQQNSHQLACSEEMMEVRLASACMLAGLQSISRSQALGRPVPAHKPRACAFACVSLSRPTWSCTL